MVFHFGTSQPVTWVLTNQKEILSSAMAFRKFAAAMALAAVLVSRSVAADGESG
jgi:hypothetical protein